MRKTLFAIFFSIIILLSTSSIVCSTSIKKTSKTNGSIPTELTNNRVSIGTITVNEDEVSCKGNLFSIKRVPKTFDLTVNYSLNAPRAGLPEIDVALAALVSLPDQENKRINQTTDLRNGELSLPLDMSDKLFAFKAYLLLGVYVTIDFSDPFNPQFGFTPDFAIVSVLLLPWGDAVTQTLPYPDSNNISWHATCNNGQNILEPQGIPGLEKTSFSFPLSLGSEASFLKGFN